MHRNNFMFKMIVQENRFGRFLPLQMCAGSFLQIQSYSPNEKHMNSTKKCVVGVAEAIGVSNIIINYIL